MIETDDFFRNIVPPQESQYVIKENFKDKRAYMIVDGHYLILIIDEDDIGKFHISNKLMLDGLIDSMNEGMGMLERHNMLMSILEKREGIIIDEVMYFFSMGPVSLPTQVGFYNEFTREARLVIEELYSYNDFVSDDIKLKNNKRIYGVNTLSSSFYEYLSAPGTKRLFLIRPTSIEANELVLLLDFNGIVANIVGSIGRGEPNGHDIDLLIDSCYKDKMDEFLFESDKLASNRYTVVINNILCQIDINYLYPEDNPYVTYYHFIGPKIKNIRASISAKKLGLKLGPKNLTDILTGKEVQVGNMDDLVGKIGYGQIKLTAAKSE